MAQAADSTNFDKIDAKEGFYVNGVQIANSSGQLIGDVGAPAGSIGTAELADDAVTNDKAANIARGSVKVGGVADAPTDLVAKTDGQILVGDGTDLKSVAVSGKISLTNAGVTAIVNDAVGAAQLNTAIIEVTVSTGQTVGASAAVPAQIAAVIMGIYPTSNQDQFVDSVVVGGDGAVTVTLAAAATADNVFAVPLLLA